MSVHVGVLALQGAFSLHIEALNRCVSAPEVSEVRTAEQLERCDALVLPGGESTAISKLLVSFDLVGPLERFLGRGSPVFGTCAGMILLASSLEDARSDQICFGAFDATVVRNGYGRQLDSFETDMDIAGLSSADSFRGVFIRAPRVASVSAEVEVLASCPVGDGSGRVDPVLCRQGSVLVSSFHPELTKDTRLHEYFLAMV